MGLESRKLYDRALKVMPGGNSRDSVFRLPYPSYAAHAQGCKIMDVDGVERVDFLNNYTSLIHGHSYPPVIEAVAAQLQHCTALSMPTEVEIRLAELLWGRVASFEQVRFTNSGSEAVMMAIKAARAFTGRPKMAKIEGAYHGSYDFAETSQTASPANWGEAAPRSVPVARGTPGSILDDVVVIPFNDIDATRAILEPWRNEIACVLIDLLPHRLGLISCSEAYLAMLWEWTQQNGALLVLDEVITLRLGYGGGQERFDIRPDLTAIGKIIGGGFPVGAVAGRADVMAVFDPRQRDVAVPHGGTFNANPVTMAAGYAAMSDMTLDAFTRIARLGSLAREKLADALDSTGVAGQLLGEGSMFCLHLKAKPLRDYRSYWLTEDERRCLASLIDRLYLSGYILAPTGMGCISTAMTEVEVEGLAAAVREALVAMRKDGLLQ